MIIKSLQRLKSSTSIQSLRNNVREIISHLESEGDFITFDDGVQKIPRDYLNRELEQIAESRTLERALYYIERLERGLREVRTSGINDINLNRWKEYDDIIIDSLWVLDKRDTTGVHSADYWGNFIPQIPQQMIKRYTKKGEWVLDCFVGNGTTLIESQRLGRNGIGIELLEDVASRARKNISAESNRNRVVSEVIISDSRIIDYPLMLSKYGIDTIQLLIVHPPYFDIIKFSDDPRDLSNAESVDDFLNQMGEVVEKASSILDMGRYLVLVIGDKYTKGEWIPLGFLTMQKVLERGFLLKSIIVKNFDHTAGKRKQKELWRYRALAGGFYLFKHEYIFVFRKK